MNRCAGQDGGDRGPGRNVRAGDGHAHHQTPSTRDGECGASSRGGGVVRGHTSGADEGTGGIAIVGEGEVTETGVAPEVQGGTAVEGEVGSRGDLATLTDTIAKRGVVEGDRPCRGENDLGVGAGKGGAGVDHGAAGVGVRRGENERAAARAAQDEPGVAATGVIHDPGVHGQGVLVVRDVQLLRSSGECPGADPAAVGSGTNGVGIVTALEQAAGDQVHGVGAEGEGEVEVADDVEAVQLVARHGGDGSCGSNPDVLRWLRGGGDGGAAVLGESSLVQRAHPGSGKIAGKFGAADNGPAPDEVVGQGGSGVELDLGVARVEGNAQVGAAEVDDGIRGPGQAGEVEQSRTAGADGGVHKRDAAIRRQGTEILDGIDAIPPEEVEGGTGQGDGNGAEARHVVDEAAVVHVDRGAEQGADRSGVGQGAAVDQGQGAAADDGGSRQGVRRGQGDGVVAGLDQIDVAIDRTAEARAVGWGCGASGDGERGRSAAGVGDGAAGSREVAGAAEDTDGLVVAVEIDGAAIDLEVIGNADGADEKGVGPAVQIERAVVDRGHPGVKLGPVEG